MLDLIIGIKKYSSKKSRVDVTNFLLSTVRIYSSNESQPSNERSGRCEIGAGRTGKKVKKQLQITDAVKLDWNNRQISRTRFGFLLLANLCKCRLHKLTVSLFHHQLPCVLSATLPCFVYLFNYSIKKKKIIKP